MIRIGVVAAAAGAAFFAGVMTTVAGVGGGVALIAVLAFFLPPQTVVVLVAPVLLVGNASRVILFRGHVDADALRWFLAAAIPTAMIGGWLLLPVLPADALRVAIGVFMLAFVGYRMLWRGRQDSQRVSARVFFTVGLAAGVVSSTVGASGVFVAPFLEARRLDRQSFVGTMAAATTGLSVAKIAGYVGGGLLTVDHVPELVAAMLGIGAGTYVGRSALDRLSDRIFRIILLTIIGLSGLRLLFS